MDDQLTALVAQHFRALAQPCRIKLIERLRRGPTTVQDLVEAVGGTQQNVSEHLSILHRAGIVAREKQGQAVRYSIVDPEIGVLLDVTRASVAHHLSKVARAITIQNASKT